MKPDYSVKIASRTFVEVFPPEEKCDYCGGDLQYIEKGVWRCPQCKIHKFPE